MKSNDHYSIDVIYGLNGINQVMTEIEVRRLQRHTDYSYFLNVPKNLARLLDMHEGDLLKFGVNSGITITNLPSFSSIRPVNSQFDIMCHMQ